MNLFKKSTIVGVSVTPERGLEVAEIDFESKTVLKYGSKPLDYNVNSRQIADLDIFKETLQDLFVELEINKNAQVILNIPAVTFRINEYPAMMDEVETSNAVSESLMSNPIFANEEPCFSAAKLPNSSMQFNRIAYTAAQYNVIYEIVRSIKDIGHKVYAIDSSVSSVFNALNYVGRLSNIEPETSWVLMIVDNCTTRVIPMIGYSAVDVFEERISIGEVLGDSENYATVLSTVQPVLKTTPSKYLYVVSTTNIISAEILAGRLQYGAPIIHQEANVYSKEAFIDLAPYLDPDIAKNISLEVIGAAIRREIEPYKSVNLNLYNSSLGDLYFEDQPPQFKLFGRTIVLTSEFLVKLFIILAIMAFIIVIPAYIMLSNSINSKNNEKEDINRQIAVIDKFLADNKDISSNTFDEGDEIKTGILHNKGVYSYYTIVGTEIPQKLWLTHLKLGDKVTIEGQADNLESIYSFYRSIKDYNQDSGIKLQKLGLASKSRNNTLGDDSNFDTESVLNSLNADFYEFRISNEPEVAPQDLNKEGEPEALPEITPTN